MRGTRVVAGPRVLVRALSWAGTGALIGVALWVVLGATAGAFVAQSTWQGAVSVLPLAMLSYALVAPVVAVIVAVICIPVYTGVFYMWALLCKRRESWDRQWNTLSAFAAAVSLVPAFGFALGSAWWPGGVFWSEFAVFLLFYFPMFWGATLLPRALVTQLQPGAFSGRQDLG